MHRAPLSLPLLFALLTIAPMTSVAQPAPLPANQLPAWHSHARVVLTEAQETAWLDLVVQQSPHRRALEIASLLFPTTDLGPATLAPGGWRYAVVPKAQPAKKGRRLYGYLPYWTMKGTTLHWGALTQLAYFGAEFDGNGTFTNLHGWGGADAKALIAKAHKNGVQVPLTVTLFAKSGIHAVLATSITRSAAIKKIIDLVISGGGDGVNIDFEGMAAADKAAMSAFIDELNTKMKKQLPGADVTLAMPAVDWSGAWDFDYLAEHSDGLMIMAYGLHWSGGPPGPNLPMGSGGPWSHKTLPWIIDDYVKYGKASNKHKFILGLPLYGHAWPSSSPAIGAKSIGKATTVTYEKGLIAAPKKGGWKWDPISQSSYYVYKSSGTWTQAWTDTAAAFDIRVKYLDKRDTQMGLWALGYADKAAPVWQSITWFMQQGAPTGGGDATVADAGGADAGPADAGPADVGAVDSGQADTAVPDTAAPDTAAPDTAAPDTAAPDTAVPDTGHVNSDAPVSADAASAKLDAAHRDTGAAAAKDGSGVADDSGLADGGGAALAPISTFAPKADSGCATGGRGAGGAGLLWVVLFAAGLIWRRRRTV